MSNLLLSAILVFRLVVVASQSSDNRALIIIDVQNCFTEGGTLAVPNGDDVIPVINNIRASFGSSFNLVVTSQDWHCSDHVSFASQHSGYDPYNTKTLHYNEDGELCRSENVTLPYAVPCVGQETTVLQQTLWPDHCVINTTDAQIHQDLTVADADILLQKGWNCGLDSYSAFYDNGRFAETDLRQILLGNNITEIFVTGLATDYCVYWTAKDGHELGFETVVIVDATRGIDPITTKEALEDMESLGIRLINSTDLEIPESVPTGSSASGSLSNSAILSSVMVMGVIFTLYILKIF